MCSTPLLVHLAIAITAFALAVAVLVFLSPAIRWKLFGPRGYRTLSIPASTVLPPVTLLPISTAWYSYTVLASVFDATLLAGAIALLVFSVASDLPFAFRAAMLSFVLAGPVFLLRRFAWPWRQHFSLAEDAVIIRNGFLTTKRFRIPFASIAMVLLLQDLPERCFGLATVFIVYASVPSHSSPPSTAILTGQSLPVATAVAASLNVAIIRSRTTGISTLPFH
jgi:uncharacterized membrane protein YdbT with pleckstrin-like domain